jgi:hypothetical protein
MKTTNPYQRIGLLLVGLVVSLGLTGCYEKDTVVYVDDNPPAVPTGVYTITGDGEVEVLWYPVREDDVDGYGVYRSFDADGAYQRIATLRDPLADYYVDRSVQNGQTYYYAVDAFDREFPGVESDARVRKGFESAVLQVPQERRPQARRRDPQLVGPARFGNELEERASRPAREDAPARHGALGRARGAAGDRLPEDPDAIARLVLLQPLFDHSRVVSGRPLPNGPTRIYPPSSARSRDAPRRSELPSPPRPCKATINGAFVSFDTFEDTNRA